MEDHAGHSLPQKNTVTVTELAACLAATHISTDTPIVRQSTPPITFQSASVAPTAPQDDKTRAPEWEQPWSQMS